MRILVAPRKMAKPRVSGIAGYDAGFYSWTVSCAAQVCGDQIAAVRVVVGGVGVLLDAQAGEGDPRRIGQRQIMLRSQRLGRADLQLAGPALRVESEGGVFMVERARIWGSPAQALDTPD